LLQVNKLQEAMETKLLTYEMQKILVSDFHKNNQRLILLDYDGTLVPFTEKPEEAKPSDELQRLLKELSQNPKNEVTLVSGRDRYTLDKWFDGLNLGLIAEHGACTKEKNTEWEIIEPMASTWKKQVH